MADAESATAEIPWSPADRRRVLQLALAGLWLLDGVLQLQPFMFSAGSNGFSGMLSDTAAGNPSALARSIRWNASVVDHHAVLTNTLFALIQIGLGLGIAWRRTTKLALAASVVWALGVWWFGEGLGGVLAGTGTPIAGGPGAVLFYALLAFLLWPVNRARSPAPFVAAQAVGTRAAQVIWIVLWGALATLSLAGSGSSPQGVRNLIANNDNGQPGWLAAIDRHAASAAAHHGLEVAVFFGVVCVVIALGVVLPARMTRVTLVVAVVIALAVWVIGENFGDIFAGGATDPNSGPLIVVLALSYWPERTRLAGPETSGEAAATAALRAGQPAAVAGAEA
jgi:hypothetical protein